MGYAYDKRKLRFTRVWKDENGHIKTMDFNDTPDKIQHVKYYAENNPSAGLCSAECGNDMFNAIYVNEELEEYCTFCNTKFIEAPFLEVEKEQVDEYTFNWATNSKSNLHMYAIMKKIIDDEDAKNVKSKLNAFQVALDEERSKYQIDYEKSMQTFYNYQPLEKSNVNPTKTSRKVPRKKKA